MTVYLHMCKLTDAVDTIVCAPVDGCKCHSKYVEQILDINKLCEVASFWIYRVSIKSFPDYKHLLQEKYVEHKPVFFSKCNST